MPLSFQRTSARTRTRTRRDGREDDEDEDLTACSAGRPSEDACEKPMLRKKTTLEMAMAERRRRLKEEERKGEVRFPASSRDDDDVKEKDEEEEEEDGDNDSSVLARIRSVQSSSYGVEVSYTGDEMISKEREREEKEDEGDEEEKQEKQERSKKEELRSETLLRKLREDGVLDSIERSTTEYWKE